MRELKREQMLDHTEILLFDILEALKEINRKLKPAKEKNDLKPCPHCGQMHENVGKFLACAKKHKKKEGG